MVFVSVGTERFPFDRLVRAVDEMAGQRHDEPIFVQTGHSTYQPRWCQWARFLPYQELVKRIGEARMVVSHAGAGSMLLCMRVGKIPIVVPRRKRFGEHVDDHQLELAARMAQLGRVVLASSPEEAMSLIHADHTRSVTVANETAQQPTLGHLLGEYLQTYEGSLTR